MAFDISLRDNGAGTFDIKLADDGGTIEKSIVFMGELVTDSFNTGATSYVFVD
jgi:hypothetical protein